MSNALPTVNERELKERLEIEARYNAKQIYTYCGEARQGDNRRKRVICMELSERDHKVRICPVWKYQWNKCPCEPSEPPPKPPKKG